MAVTIAQVAVEQTVYHFDKPYDYFVPSELVTAAKLGVRVLIPFGSGNRSRQGMIMSVISGESIEKIKPIIKVLDDEPIVSDEQIKMAIFIKEQTFCTLFDAFRLMFPTGINYKITPKYCICEEPCEDTNKSVNTECQKVLDVLKSQKKALEQGELLALCELPNDSTAVDRLFKAGLIMRTDDINKLLGDKTAKTVRLCEKDENEESHIKLTLKQKAVVDLLNDIGTASVKEVCYFTGVGEAIINNLIKKDVLEQYNTEVLRNPYKNITVDVKDIELNNEQQKVFNDLNLSLEEDKPSAALLFGVTGSGKTQIYLKLIDEVLKQGKSVLVMVPEIALTPQTLSIFHLRYGSAVAVFHSGLSLGERMDEWKRVKRGEATIAIGTRSAVFAPLSNIGIIVIDEEQENSYKSEASPRYHARDIARFRAAYHNALLLLGSATPSVESFCKAKAGVYALERIDYRYGASKLPSVITADMREELKNGNETGISEILREKLKETLQNGNQSILLLNRRGYNTFISCRECGEVLTCKNCSISMVYHHDNGRVMCHYCGHSEAKPQKCEKCGGEFIRFSGAGTQRAEEELSTMFPDARILRMDADSTIAKGSHKEKLDDFAAGKYDILLGTQMVAKGLDFPKVTLVGILNADQVFYNNDYRSYERAFSLLTQVIGRAGRSEDEGIAVIQTCTPENELIQLAATQDYDTFYEQEIAVRQLMKYPPYCDICMIGFVGDENNITKEAAEFFLNQIKVRGMNGGDYNDVKIKVLGPSSAQILRVNAKFRYKIIIKCNNTKRFRQMMHEILTESGKRAEFKRVTAYIDINPSSII